MGDVVEFRELSDQNHLKPGFIPAAVGDLVVVKLNRERTWAAGLVAEIDDVEHWQRIERFGSDALVYDGYSIAYLISAATPNFHFEAAVTAAKRRGGKRFRSTETARRFFMPFWTVQP